MIKYSLKCLSSYCSDENKFDGWFQNIEAYEKQKLNNLLVCPICGSDEVIKLLTTPSFLSNKNKLNNEILKNNKDKALPPSTNKHHNNIINVPFLLRAIKKEIKKNAKYVGDNFVQQVRSMQEGKIKEKSIYGHGTNKDIEELKDDGIDVFSIPWIPDDN